MNKSTAFGIIVVIVTFILLYTTIMLDHSNTKMVGELDNLPEKYNEAICDIMEIKCPKNPEFKTDYNMDLGRTYVTQYKNQTQYTFYFDESDPSDLTYRICETENYDKYDGDCQWQHRYLDGR